MSNEIISEAAFITYNKKHNEKIHYSSMLILKIGETKSRLFSVLTHFVCLYLTESFRSCVKLPRSSAPKLCFILFF